MFRVTSVSRCLIVAVLLVLTWSLQAAGATPPVAPVRPVVDNYFGTRVTDNYRWMENLKDPEMQRWMKAQAAYTRATLDALPGYDKLLERIAELTASAPAQVSDVQIVGGRYYSLRTPANAQSPNLFVRDGIKGEDRLLIDPQRLSTDSTTHLSIHDFRPSPDGRYVAYKLAAGGSEEPVLHILDVRTGKDLPETADRVYGEAPFWRSDSRSFFYLRGLKPVEGQPAINKFDNPRTYLHVLGRPFDADPPILGHGVSDAHIAMAPIDEAEIHTNPGSRFAVAVVTHGADPHLRVYAAPVKEVKNGKTAWRPIAVDSDDQATGNMRASTVALVGDSLYWLSRKHAPRGQILKQDLSRPDSTPQLAVAQGALPISAVYAGQGALWWRVNNAGTYSIHRLLLKPGARPEKLNLPYAGSVDTVIADATSGAVALMVSSYLRSQNWLGVDPHSGALVDNGLQPAGPYDHPDDLVVEDLEVKSWDGTLVPLSIIHKKGMALDGDHLAMITGYGAYGMSLSPFYFPPMRALYDRGGINVIAHVRGGGELGEAWHKAGYKASKPNTWKDFIACAQYLVDHHYTRPAKLFGWGQSAGGIMIGRAIEERPDLFGVAVIRVPAADMLRFETTTNGAWNVPEFGTIKTEAGFKALYAMSPYAHVKDGVKYPATLIYAGANDQRVAAWIPAKFAARLQAASTNARPVLLRVDYDAGHTGFDATRAQENRNIADMLAFGFWQTGDPAFQAQP